MSEAKWSQTPQGAVLGLLTTALFGVSAPLAKRRLDERCPQRLGDFCIWELASACQSSESCVPTKPSSRSREVTLPQFNGHPKPSSHELRYEG